ncbi:alpha/beta hydrolase [Leptospira sp. GIMC2001]|uniref:alpha/beta hydrolase n=1 Tax=Leptospira sp. GIMC2001 TaxID=1513297 RepID=UPI0023499993|nr:alpha/beta hydrolase [Leptospira sp. GIMC2001]WCL50608.1 alpha/beta hydrolase [Leptospira sp. GIMC2001]
MLNLIKKILLMGIFLNLILNCQSRTEVRNSKQPIQSKTIVFIHGMFMTPLCWQDWEKEFRSKGYKTYSPAWPLHDKTPSQMRTEHPNPKLGELGLKEIVEHYEKFILTLPEKPIIIGHSMGALVTQILMQKDLGSGYVAIRSAPPKGVLSLKWSFIKSNWNAISPFADKKEPFLLTYDEFKYALANTLTDEDAKSTYEKYVTPESRYVVAEAQTDIAKLEYEKNRAPLLFISASEDRITPARLNYSNFSNYPQGKLVTDYFEFTGVGHLLNDQTAKDEIIYVLKWLNE